MSRRTQEYLRIGPPKPPTIIAARTWAFICRVCRRPGRGRSAKTRVCEECKRGAAIGGSPA